MDLWVSLEPPSTTVDAGSSGVIALRIRNTGDIVEEYRIDLVGDPAHWCTVEPSSVRLYPGTTATVHLTFAPPRSPDSAAGPHPFGARVTPAENHEAVMVPEGNVTVTPFVDVRAELLPVTVRGWRRARPRLVVDNYGNATATAAVAATTPGSQVDFDIRAPSIQVPPGRAHFSVLRVRPQRLLWLGQKVTHPFTATLQLSGGEPVSASGAYLQTALLPRWMARLFAALLALIAVFMALWLKVHPSVSTAATAEPSSAPTAVMTSPSSSPTPSPSTTPSPSAAASTTAGGGGGGAAASKSPAPTPVAWWKLNDGSGGIAKESPDNDDPATLTNVNWCADGGDCAVFGGDSTAATGGAVLDTAAGKSFTVMCWARLSSTGTGIQTMVSQDGTVASGFYLQYLGSTDGDHWAFSRPTSRAVANVTAQAGTWTFLAGVFDGTDNQLTVYVDGQEQGTATDAAPSASDGPLIMGRARSYNEKADWFTGDLAQVEVYDRALSGAMIRAVEPSVP